MATLSVIVDATGFMSFPPPRRYRGRGGRPWLRSLEWDRFNRMAIEELPEQLPEWDMYCRGVPYDEGAGEVQSFNPGGNVKVEWDIVQPEGGNCAIKLVCPSRGYKNDLWSGECGQSPGKAASQAMIPRDFSCRRGECFISWFYQTTSSRRYCNCFDIEVNQSGGGQIQPPQGEQQPPQGDQQPPQGGQQPPQDNQQPPQDNQQPPQDSQQPPQDNQQPTSQPQQPPNNGDEVPPQTDSAPSAPGTDSIVFTSTEVGLTTDVVTQVITSAIGELPGTTLTQKDVLPTVYQTGYAALPSSKLELTGAPLAPMTCTPETLLVTMLQTMTEVSTSTCTETKIMTETVVSSETMYLTSVMTESHMETVTERAQPVVSYQTVYMTEVVTSTVPGTMGDVGGASQTSPLKAGYMTSASGLPSGEAQPLTTKLAKAPVKFY